MRNFSWVADPDPERTRGATVHDVTGLAVHEHHLWRVDKIKALVAVQRDAVTFFCGGSRNFTEFIGLFNGVFVLEVDAETLTCGSTTGGTTSGEDKAAKRNGTLYSDCIAQKRTFREMASPSTPPLRSRTLLTRSWN